MFVGELKELGMKVDMDTCVSYSVCVYDCVLSIVCGGWLCLPAVC